MEPAQAHLLSPQSHQCWLRHPYAPQGPRTRSRPPCTGERWGLQAAPGSSVAQGPHLSGTAPAGETINREQGPQATQHWCGGAGVPPPCPSGRQRTPLLLLAAVWSTTGAGGGPSPRTNRAQSPVGSSPSAPRAAPVLTAARAEPGSSTPGPGSPVSEGRARGERRRPESSPEALPAE